MSSIRPLLVAVALGAATTACGNAQDGVEKAFRDYHAALLARDFRTACSYNTQQATDKLLVSLRTQGINAGSCEEAFADIYAEPEGAAQADGVGHTVQIQGITVDGDNASVNWTAQLDGEQQPATSTMQRVDGQWRFVAD